MAKYEYRRASSAPRWAGDFIGADTMVPGGGRINPADVPTNSEGRKFLPAGTLVGRTFAERETNTAFGPAADGDDELFLTVFDVQDAAKNNDIEFYRPNSTVKENFLPNWATLSATLKAKLRALYVTQKGVI